MTAWLASSSRSEAAPLSHNRYIHKDEYNVNRPVENWQTKEDAGLMFTQLLTTLIHMLVWLPLGFLPTRWTTACHTFSLGFGMAEAFPPSLMVYYLMYTASKCSKVYTQETEAKSWRTLLAGGGKGDRWEVSNKILQTFAMYQFHATKMNSHVHHERVGVLLFIVQCVCVATCVVLAFLFLFLRCAFNKNSMCGQTDISIEGFYL